MYPNNFIYNPTITIANANFTTYIYSLFYLGIYYDPNLKKDISIFQVLGGDQNISSITNNLKSYSPGMEYYNLFIGFDSGDSNFILEENLSIATSIYYYQFPIGPRYNNSKDQFYSIKPSGWFTTSMNVELFNKRPIGCVIDSIYKPGSNLPLNPLYPSDIRTGVFYLPPNSNGNNTNNTISLSLVNINPTSIKPTIFKITQITQ